MEAKEFVFGKGKSPDWFNEKCLQGRAKVNYDEDGNKISATVHTPTKTVTANIGDSIMLIRSGLQVIPADKAKKFKVQRNVKENSTESKAEE